MKILFRLSDKAIENYLLNKGINYAKKQSLEVDFTQLPQIERAFLLTNCKRENDNLLLGYNKQYPYSGTLLTLSNHDNTLETEGTTLEDIQNAVNKVGENYKRIQEENRKKKEDSIKEFIQGNTSYINGYDAYYRGTADSLCLIPLEKVSDFVQEINPDLVGDVAERVTILNNKVKEERETYKTELQEKKEQQEKAKNELKDWSLKNGSPLLKARIQENMNWLELAEEEYFNVVCPDGFTLDISNSGFDLLNEYDINNADLTQIKELRNVRETFNNAELVRVRYEETENEYYEEEQEVKHVDYIRIKLHSPTTYTFAYKFLGEYEPETD